MLWLVIRKHYFITLGPFRDLSLPHHHPRGRVSGSRQQPIDVAINEVSPCRHVDGL
jgi:hypothetical protein